VKGESRRVCTRAHGTESGTFDLLFEDGEIERVRDEEGVKFDDSLALLGSKEGRNISI